MKDEHAERTGEVLDELLVLRIRQGSRNAFEALVERWQERLWRHARRLTGNDEAAWDVVQESWAAVAKGLQGLRDPGAFRSWIYTIATRAATNRLRRLRPEHPSPSEALDEHPAPEFTDDLERGEAVLLLRRAIARLPRESQVLIQLFYVEELSVRELARVLDVPVGTVKSRLHQARTKLKEILERTPS